MSSMIWSRLKNFKCPVCNRVLELDDGEVLCPRWHLRIPFSKFEEMVNYLYRKRKAPAEWLDLILKT